ncbi:Hypothetical protein FKW44_009951 [Caligus rogercresseyi]|uniref:Uncharacterized protein n=1 Tax=Caligus rogercresseyi TaxID=217165 RepID=A0A7T8HFW1_CALRO|nr:Hypothetical protein FKW44_009951 [Caligus rogercresseyi]
MKEWPAQKAVRTWGLVKSLKTVPSAFDKDGKCFQLPLRSRSRLAMEKLKAFFSMVHVTISAFQTPMKHTRGRHLTNRLGGW